MASNRDLEEVNDWQSRKNNPFFIFLKQTSPAVILSLILLFLLGWYMVQKSKVNSYVALAVFVVLILIMMFMKRKEEKEPLPLSHVRILAVNFVERSVGFVYPSGTRVEPHPYARMRQEGHWGDKFEPFKWEVGVKVIYPDLLEKVVLILMDPYTGFIEGAIAQPGGYTGELAKDIKVMVPNYSLQENKPK